MRNATKVAVVTVGLFFVSIWFVMAAGITAIWLTDKVRVFGFVILPPTIVATVLVLYFDWRARLFDRVRDEAPVVQKTAEEESWLIH